jgi:hypothetical protein
LRLDAVQVTVQQDISSTGELLREAGAAGDVELFTMLLSGRDPEWTRTQQQLVQQRLFWDRPAMNLQLQPGTSRSVSTTMDPNLQAAEHITQHLYQAQTAKGEINTVTLQQTTIFRQGEQGWLFSPPAEAFWGPPPSLSGMLHPGITTGKVTAAQPRSLPADLAGLPSVWAVSSAPADPAKQGEAQVLVDRLQADYPHADPLRLMHAINDHESAVTWYLQFFPAAVATPANPRGNGTIFN